MTTRDTHELEEAGQKLSLETLKESLRLNKGDPDSKKPVLLMRIGDRVIEIGIEGFLQHLEFSYLEQACKAVKIDTEEGKKSRTLLYEKIVEDGLNSFLCTCSFPLLKEFCRVLLLEEGTRDSMSQQITDEIMLTGTKKFFHNLTPVLLKKWCEQLNLKTTGTKKVLVERLMVGSSVLVLVCHRLLCCYLSLSHISGPDVSCCPNQVDIFELEPLAATEEPEKKQAKKKDTTSNNKKQEKKQTEDKEKERREEEEIQKKEKDVSEEDSEDDEREGGRGRGKYVAPPLSTIKKGAKLGPLFTLCCSL